MKLIPIRTFARFEGVLHSVRDVEFLEFLETKSQELQSGRKFTEEQMSAFLDEFGVTKSFYADLSLTFKNGRYTLR